MLAAACGSSDDGKNKGDGSASGGDGSSSNNDGTSGGDGGVGKINSALIAQQASSRAKDIIHQMGGAITFIGEDGSTIPKLTRASTDAGGGVIKMAIRQPLPSPLARSFDQTPALRVIGGNPAPTFLTVEEQFDSTADDLSVFIKDRVLVGSNIESQTDTQITYLLKPDPTCRPLSSSGGGGSPDGGAGPDAGASDVDPDCASDLTKLQVRVVVTADGDGARFQILLGEQRLELSVIIIHSDLLAWEANLAKAKQATDYANSVLGKKPGEQVFPVNTLVGTTRVALKKDGEKKITLSFSVIEAIEVDAMDIYFKTAKSDPFFSFTADGIGKTATLKLAVGDTDVKAAWDPKNQGLKNREFEVSIGGIYGETTVTEANKELNLKGIGVGQSFVAVRGTHVFDLNLNPNDGRKLDVKALVAAGDVPHFEVTPKVDLTLAFKLNVIAAELSSAPPKEFLDETYTITFVPGGAPPAILEMIKKTTTFGGGMKVVAGTLTLKAASNANATVTVPAGQCLVGVDMPPSGSHPLLGSVAAGACQ